MNFNTSLRKEPYSGKVYNRSKGTLFMVDGIGGGHDSGYAWHPLCMHAMFKLGLLYIILLVIQAVL